MSVRIKTSSITVRLTTGGPMTERLLILLCLVLLICGCAQTGTYRKYQDKYPKACPCGASYDGEAYDFDRGPLRLAVRPGDKIPVRGFMRSLLYWPVTCVWSVPQAIRNRDNLDVLG
jgi:hypothetical protein